MLEFNPYEYIEKQNKKGIVLGLLNITELLDRLDNPQNKCKCLHIAGTNGKGSVFSFVEDGLMEAGFTVGRYVSPTVIDYLERFQINKKMMSEDEFKNYVAKIIPIVEKMRKEGYTITAFEQETAIAFLYFADNNVDYMLIECGMGGAEDATNVSSNTFMTCFSSISMDHMQYLGDTIEDIAMAKAGIIKQDSICVTSKQESSVEKIISDVCRKNNATLYIADDENVRILCMDKYKTVFEYPDETTDRRYEIKLLGRHQIKNAITAITVLRNIEGVSDENIRDGIAKTTWMGRMTKVCDKPEIYVDGAHNEDAWKKLREAINYYFTNNKITFIIGVLKDKEYTKMIDILCDCMKYAVVITPDSPRALDKDVLKRYIEEKGISVTTADNPKQAIDIAKKSAKEDGAIVVCGSLSFLKDYLKRKY